MEDPYVVVVKPKKIKELKKTRAHGLVIQGIASDPPAEIIRAWSFGAVVLTPLLRVNRTQTLAPDNPQV